MKKKMFLLSASNKISEHIGKKMNMFKQKKKRNNVVKKKIYMNNRKWPVPLATQSRA